LTYYLDELHGKIEFDEKNQLAKICFGQEFQVNRIRNDILNISCFEMIKAR